LSSNAHRDYKLPFAFGMSVVVGTILLPAVAGWLIYARAQGYERFVGAERIARGRLRAPASYTSIVQGVLAGICFGAWTALLFIIRPVPMFPQLRNIRTQIAAGTPFGSYEIGLALLSGIVVLTIACLFELVRTRIQSEWGAICVASILYTLGFGLETVDTTQFERVAFFSFLTILPLTAIYRFWGFATAALALATSSLAGLAVSARHLGHPTFVTHANWLLVLILVAVFVGVFGYIRARTDSDGGLRLKSYFGAR
jgi:hypothetical protein